MTNPRILFWDLELSPMSVYSWSLWPNSIGTHMIQETQRVICWGARWYDKKSVMVGDEREGRKEMLERLWELLNEADFVVSWNGQSFDTKHINREFIENGMTPPSPYREIDLMRVVKKNMKFASNKLDHVAQQLGLGQKVATSFDLWKGCMAGDEASWRKMLRYQRQDVNLLVLLFDKLKPWIKFPHPVTDELNACRNCGNTQLQNRGLARTLNGTYQRYQCVGEKGCGAWGRFDRRTPIGNTRNV